jgi:methylmalonyl-CoA mutase N-terminal domain/subunit
MQDEIERSAYDWAKGVESNEKIVVGVNRFTEDGTGEPEVFPIDPALQRAQVARLQKLRKSRDASATDAALRDVDSAARGTANLLEPMRSALKSGATLGEVSDVLRLVFGTYTPAN